MYFHLLSIHAHNQIHLDNYYLGIKLLHHLHMRNLHHIVHRLQLLLQFCNKYLRSYYQKEKDKQCKLLALYRYVPHLKNLVYFHLQNPINK
jgi:hypothetical protein